MNCICRALCFVIVISFAVSPVVAPWVCPEHWTGESGRTPYSRDFPPNMHPAFDRELLREAVKEAKRLRTLMTDAENQRPAAPDQNQRHDGAENNNTA
ncbi:hypothetical protein DdX_18251 [Ditylenchus destructor]|uniref:Secreted protein n=1 Tax=Ditylenchus destructor TaxID=166010 RepID=A0AAD4QY95_9BILA|nr:hypothetical protein DdX_18251 [Ditylenchus destructor]